VDQLNYSLMAMMERGLPTMPVFGKRREKCRYSYRITPQGMTERVPLTRHLPKCRVDEHHPLKAEVEHLTTGVGGEEAKGPLKASR
jgi:hypothetical protein